MAEKTAVEKRGRSRGPVRRFLAKAFPKSEAMDKIFLFLVLIILAVGLVSLLSASFAYSYYNEEQDSYHYIRRQILFALAGVVLMLIISRIDYHVLKRFSLLIMGISLLALIVVMFLPEIQNVHRWIRFGPINIQVSEVAKFAVILLFAHMISNRQEQMKNPKQGFFPFVLVLVVVCGLVVIEPHLSGTILIGFIGLTMMFVGGSPKRWLLVTVLAGIAAAAVLVFVIGYEKDRIEVFLDPFGVFTRDRDGRDQAWQTVQSLFAIGSGGLMGEGLGSSRQKHLFLPEPQNDFIFAVVCEELGFIGAVLVIVLFAALVWRGMYLATKAPDRFGAMLALGLTVQVGYQVILNIAVVSNSMPNTGISLPFFSYGGSSLIMLLMQMGVVLSISRQCKRGKPAAEEADA